MALVGLVSCTEKNTGSREQMLAGDSLSLPPEIRQGIQDRGYSGYFLEDVKPQQMQWSAKQDTMLVGKEGVRIHLYKDCLVQEDGTPVQGPVDIQLKEYLSPGAMILAGMTTRRQDGGFLRTGGMIHLTAQSKGKELKVSDTHPLKLDFPVRGEEVKGMRLFEGGRNTQGSVEWSFAQKQPARLKAVPDSGSYVVFDYLPRCLNCLKNLGQDLNREWTAYFPETPGNFALTVEIEPGGSISYVGFPDSFPENLVPGVLNSLENSAPYFSARAGGRERRYPATVNLNFIPVKNKMQAQVASPDMEEYTYSLLRQMMDQEIYKPYWEKSLEVKKDGQYPIYMEPMEIMPEWKIVSPLLKEIRYDSLVFDYSKWKQRNNQLNYYSVFSYSLGILNCDAFDNYPPSKLRLFEIGSLPEGCVGVVYFSDRKSLLHAQSVSAKSISFGKLPNSGSFQLICYGPVDPKAHKENTDWYFCQEKISNANWSKPALDFKVISYTRLMEQIQKIQ